MNQEVLKKISIIFNLSKSESEVLSFLFDLESPWPISSISSELGIPRQTVYSILKKLVKRGFVIEIIKKKDYKKTSFFKFSPERLLKEISTLHDYFKNVNVF